MEGFCMKKFLLALALLGLLLCFANCGKANTLTVYVVDTEPLYVRAVDRFASDNPDINLEIEKFSNYEEMNDRLNTELMSGKGPDVLLLNSNQSDSDPLKLSQSGTFLALDGYMRELDEADYFSPMMNAGKLDGTQYFLPLSWNVLQAYCGEDVAGEVNLDQLFDAFRQESERLKSDESMAVSSIQISRADLTNYFLETAGVILTDGKMVTVDKEQFAEVSTFTKMFYENLPQIRVITNRYSNDLAGVMAHVSFLLEDYSMPNTIRYYQSVYPNFVGKNATVSFFPQFDGGMTAQIVHYGAINASTEMQDEAWALLRYVFQQECSMSFGKYDAAVYYAPVTVTGYEDCLEGLCSEGVSGTAIKPMNQENRELLTAVTERITDAVIPNRVLGSIVEESMMPYYQGSADFDSCYENMIQKVNLYLSE